MDEEEWSRRRVEAREMRNLTPWVLEQGDRFWAVEGKSPTLILPLNGCVTWADFFSLSLSIYLENSFVF
jgi:hypothetical protein